MSFLRIEVARDEFLVVFLYITSMSHFEQVVTRIHLFAERVESLFHLLHVGYNRFFFVGQFGKEMAFDIGIYIELNLFGVNKHKLQF